MALLSVKNLSVEFDTYGGKVKAVRGVSFDVNEKETLAIVGESGCGKSVTVQALMKLIPMPPGRITSGSAQFLGKDLVAIDDVGMSAIRGREIGMIFQDPMTSLNPTMPIGKQISETLVVHKGMSVADGMKRAAELLELTRIPEAKKRVHDYPFQFSGGMLQRTMIAMAMACEPKILIADEPTTALDVTIQAQILELMNELQKEKNMAIILITHDLGVVAQMAHRVAVMYAGQVIETGSVEDVYERSAHPYTVGLKGALPSLSRDRTKLTPIEGSPPDLFRPPQGCGYFARCPHAMKACQIELPHLGRVQDEHLSRCWLHHPLAPKIDGFRHAPSREGWLS